jgi:hypothetical protein
VGGTCLTLIRPMPIKRTPVSRKQLDSDATRRGIHDAINPHDVVMMYRFQAMEPEEVRAYLEGCQEMAAAGERKELEEKADSWRESLAPSTAIDTD